MVVKKYKKSKKDTGYEIPTAINIHIKEPFFYSEDVIYPELNDPRSADAPNKSVYDALLDLNHVIPFGYATEQYFRGTKQDIHDKLEEMRHHQRNNEEEG